MEKLVKYSGLIWLFLLMPILVFGQKDNPCAKVQLSYLDNAGWKVDKIYADEQFALPDNAAYTFVFKFKNGVFSIEDQDNIYYGAYAVANDSLNLVFQENSEEYETDSSNMFPKKWSIVICSQFTLVLKSKFYAKEDSQYHDMEYRFRAIRPQSN